MLKAIVLIALTTIYRLVPHPWNATPMGALSLYAGAKLPLRWAWLVPVGAMALSDLVLDYGTGRPLLEFSRIAVYSTFGLLTLIGPLANRSKFGPALLPGLSLAASGVFFLTSNLGVWAEGLMYPMNSAGLLACYVAGLPYFDRTVLADLIGTAVFFGLGSLIHRAYTAVTARPELGEVNTVDSALGA